MRWKSADENKKARPKGRAEEQTGSVPGGSLSLTRALVRRPDPSGRDDDARGGVGAPYA